MALTQNDIDRQQLAALRTERLVLDALTLADLPVVHAEWGVPEVARMMTRIKPGWSMDDARDWIEKRSRLGRDGFDLAIRLQDGTLIGSIALGGDPYDLGYLLAPRYWGKGYASEALGVFLRAAFRQFDDLAQIDATVFDDNPASAAVLRKSGFVKIGPSDCQSVARLEPAANTLYRLTRSSLKV